MDNNFWAAYWALTITLWMISVAVWIPKSATKALSSTAWGRMNEKMFSALSGFFNKLLHVK